VAMIKILKQGSRLYIEAAVHTSDVNEAYLMVHNTVALAMSQSEHLRIPIALLHTNPITAVNRCCAAY
jgi:hypothetical protein